MYKQGEKVWFRRPATLSAGLYIIWEGPSVVLRRVGQGSYVISTPGAAEQAVHEDQLKPFVEDRYVGEPIPLHYYRGGEYDTRVRPGEEEVEKIHGHKMKMDGKLLLLTKWKGKPRSTWEPVGNFVHRYSGIMARYVKDQGLEIDLWGQLPPWSAV